MRPKRHCILFLAIACASGCGESGRTNLAAERTVTVAAASNLAEVFDEIGQAFHRQTGIRVTYSYGSTAQLAQQIRSGAPFDLFAAADTEHVDQLIREGKLQPDSRAVYARGQLVLWLPKGDASRISDLVAPEVRFVAIANPQLAPYGKAAVEALKAANIWKNLQSKITYANTINAAKQFAATGNADAAFTAASLVLHERGTVLRIDPDLHSPLDQALGILTASTKPQAANSFRDFVLGPNGKKILAKYAYR